MAGTFDELKQLMGKIGGQPASNGIVTVPNATYPAPYTGPGMHIPVTIPPGGSFTYLTQPKHPVLSDFDIELMAACISNKHPVVDGQSHCFCTLKRLERGISKD